MRSGVFRLKDAENKQPSDTIGRASPFDEAITEGPGDATRLTREALRGGRRANGRDRRG
jgi:hypothetical protein